MLFTITPHFTTPSTINFTPRRHHNHHLRRSATVIKMSTTPSPPQQTIEHIVLFKVKDGTDQSKVNSMVTSLDNLKSLNMVLYLTTGPVHKYRSGSGSGSGSLNFTHMLHSRYMSKEDLAQYSAHQSHLDAVRSTVFPISDDLMAVDWVASNLTGPISPDPGSGLRVQFVKLKEDVGEKQKEEILNELKRKVNGVDQVTVGENFSPARAKGFSIASIRVYSSVEGMDSDDGNVGDSVKDYIDDVIVIDYVIPWI